MLSINSTGAPGTAARILHMSCTELLTPRRKSPAATMQVTTSITANCPLGGCRAHGFQQGTLQQVVVIRPFVSAFVANIPLPAQRASSARCRDIQLSCFATGNLSNPSCSFLEEEFEEMTVQPAAFPAAMGPLEPAISPGLGNKNAWNSTTDAGFMAAASKRLWTLKYRLHLEGLDSHL